MNSKKITATIVCLFCALVAQAQDFPEETGWESDPLDVLETQEPAVAEPAFPEFQEINDEGSIDTVDQVPAPSIPQQPEQDSWAETPPADQSFETPAVTTTEAAPMQWDTSTSEPDYSKEAEFHRIYKTYNERPTSEEEWGKVVGSRESDVYQVQKGDTLWEISSVFFGDPNYWPKIWALNKGSILNPHQINPSMQIKFFPGSAADAPTLELAETPAAGSDQDQDQAVVPLPKLAAQSLDGVEIPPPKKRTPLLRQLPGSIPEHRMAVVTKPKIQLDLDNSKLRIPAGMEALGYYIDDVPAVGVGVITGTEMAGTTAGNYQYVFVRLDQPGGKDFIVQRNLGPVVDASGKKHGAMIETQGELEVLAKVNESKNIYRALVKRTLHPVQVGSIVLPGNIPVFSPAAGAASNSVSAKIIGGQFNNERKLYGTNTIVFLDGGSSQGFQEGQVLSVYKDETIRKNKDAVINDPVIGKLKVIRVSQNYSTAYIVNSITDIVTGDYVGGNSAQASNASAPLMETEMAPSSDSEDDFSDFENSAELPDSSAEPESGADDFDLDL